MSESIKFELVSPEKIVLATTAEMVVVPGAEGDFAVLAGHVPMISALRPGAVEIYQGNTVVDRLFVPGGFAEVSLDRLTVLADEAVSLASLDRARVDAMIADAKEDLDDATADDARARAQEKLDQLQALLEAL
jgi:F-type H+-transporting ATPase subunit epsilon